jgi:hypothetical protein
MMVVFPLSVASVERRLPLVGPPAMRLVPPLPAGEPAIVFAAGDPDDEEEPLDDDLPVAEPADEESHFDDFDDEFDDDFEEEESDPDWDHPDDAEPEPPPPPKGGGKKK